MSKVPPPVDPREGTPLNEEEQQVLHDVLNSLSTSLQLKAKALPYHMLERCIRGYMDYKNRVQEMVLALTNMINWREENDIDNILNHPQPYQHEFHTAWPSHVTGTDPHGHLIVAERLSEIDARSLADLPLGDVLRLRGQYQEVLEVIKESRGQTYGAPRPKIVFILDLEGLSLGKHFSKKARVLLKHVFAIGGNNYPESLSQMFIINTSTFFLTAWKIMQPWIDPITLKKILLLGGRDSYMKEFAKWGIGIDQLPGFVGGSCTCTTVADHLDRIMRSRGWDGTPLSEVPEIHVTVSADGDADTTAVTTTTTDLRQSLNAMYGTTTSDSDALQSDGSLVSGSDIDIPSHDGSSPKITPRNMKHVLSFEYLEHRIAVCNRRFVQ